MRRFLVPVTLLLITLASCNDNTAKPEGDKEQDSICPQKVEIGVAPTSPQKATLLFDASYSMKGYLDSSNDSRFSGVISSFMNIPKDISVHFYGDKEKEAISHEEFKDKLNKRNIPWSQESNIIAMIESMIKHINSGSNVCFLVTDAILSGSNHDIANSPNRSYNIKERQTMANNLFKILENQTKYSALLVRYKAKFKGKYSCFDNAVRSISNRERPFYIIAMGKWEYIKSIEEGLKNKRNANDINTPYEHIAMFGDCISYNKLGFTYGDGLKAETKNTYKIKNGCNEVELKSTNLTALPDYMQTQEYLDKNIELLVKYNGKNDIKVLDKNSYSIKLNKEKKICSIRIKSSAIKNSDLTCKLNYKTPAWIENFSDDDDHDILTIPLEVEKTFNLKYLAHGFTALNNNNNIVKEQTFKIK